VKLIAPLRETNLKAGRSDTAIPGLPAEMYAVLGLSAFERFAFILSVLEGYSDQDSALLLGCTRQMLMTARVHAEQQIVHAVAVRDGRPSDINPQNQDSALELAIAAHLTVPA
jgi:DNA-directed RNA polymerase specialized sigma24 family protein